MCTLPFTSQVEAERLAAEAILRNKEAYLRQLYASFVPLWAKLWEEEPEESGFEFEDGPTAMWREEGNGGKGRETRGGETIKHGFRFNSDGEADGNIDDHDHKARGKRQEDSDESDRSATLQRPTMWWRGADAPHIWKGPPKPAVNGKLAPGARFVPAERALLDGLEPQTVSVGRLSKEYLTLLGLPHESIRDMYEKASSTVLRRSRFTFTFPHVGEYSSVRVEGRTETMSMSGT